MMNIKKIPGTYVLLFWMIVIAAACTWIIPGGEFQREEIVVGGMKKQVIVQGSYKPVESQGQSWEIFSAFFNGFVHKADIIVFIFIVGGAFMIVQRSQSINIGIRSFLNYTQSLKQNRWLKWVDNLIIAGIMLLFSLFGAVFGMSEETIAFVLVFVPLAVSMGYDAIVGVAMCFVGAGLGFAGAILNPFTIGVAQGIAGLPLFSGLEYRFFCFAIINLIGIGYVIRYASRIKKDPSRSPVAEINQIWKQQEDQETEPVIKPVKTTSGWLVYVLLSVALSVFAWVYPVSTMHIGASEISGPFLAFAAVLFILAGFFSLRHSVHYFVLLLLFFSIVYIIIGVMGHGWYIMEIATAFLALGIFSGIALGYSADTIVDQFMDGIKDIASAALVVGLAAGIIEVLEAGKIIDTILYGISNAFRGAQPAVAVNLMYIFQIFINTFVPSGSGQAALTMPVMAPLSDLLGISRQAAVLAFQFGDGFTNMIIPTSATLIGVLGMAKIPFEKWFAWMWPLQVILILTAMVLLTIAVNFRFNGF